MQDATNDISWHASGNINGCRIRIKSMIVICILEQIMLHLHPENCFDKSHGETGNILI